LREDLGRDPLFDGSTGLVCAVARSKTPWDAATPNDAPIIVSEFKDENGRDAVMVVNNSQTKNIYAKITLRRAIPRSPVSPGRARRKKPPAAACS